MNQPIVRDIALKLKKLFNVTSAKQLCEKMNLITNPSTLYYKSLDSFLLLIEDGDFPEKESVIELVKDKLSLTSIDEVEEVAKTNNCNSLGFLGGFNPDKVDFYLIKPNKENPNCVNAEIHFSGGGEMIRFLDKSNVEAFRKMMSSYNFV